MDYTVHRILQARILEWVAFPFSGGSPQPMDRTHVLSITQFFTNWAIREALIRCKSLTTKKSERFPTVVLEKTLESLLDGKEIKPVNPKGNQPWIFIGGTDVEVKAPILWPTGAKSWLIGKELILGRIEGRRMGWQRMRWFDGIINLMNMSLIKLWEIVKDRKPWHAAFHEVAKSRTWLSDWKTTTICILFTNTAPRGNQIDLASKGANMTFWHRNESYLYHINHCLFHWRDWCWSWNSNTLATSCEELTHWKRPWCWERLRAGGEGGDRGWDGWMASPTRWTWVWVDSGSWWWTGRLGMLQFMGSQRVRYDWATELTDWTTACVGWG